MLFRSADDKEHRDVVGNVFRGDIGSLEDLQNGLGKAADGLAADVLVFVQRQGKSEASLGLKEADLHLGRLSLSPSGTYRASQEPRDPQPERCVVFLRKNGAGIFTLNFSFEVTEKEI